MARLKKVGFGVAVVGMMLVTSPILMALLKALLEKLQSQ